MNFKVSSTALNSRLSTASKVLASKNSMPILDCFLIEIQDGNLQLTASDAEKCLITNVPVIEQNGSARFCVDAKTLMNSIKEIPEQPITIEFNENSLELKGRHSSGQFTIMAQDASPYPAPRPVEDGQEIALPAETILNGINRCLFATANDEVRLVMNGIFFDLHQDHLILAGTDGRKLVKNTLRSVQPGVEGGFILPKKVASILKNIIGREDGDVHIRFTHDRASFYTQDVAMHFRLIDGNYPNYNAVIPVSNPYHATIERTALASALKRISAFCNQSSGLVKLELKQNQVKLTGQDNEYSTSAEEYLTCDYNNNPISIGFACQFLIEICNIIEGESIILELADPSRPGICRPANEENGDELLMLLMPMRVEE